MPSVFLALGSNIDPENNLKAAATMLREKFPDIRFSPVYRTAPVGYAKQEDFLNAVAMFESDARLEEIAAALHVIELHLKKNPPFRFGPRTIDLDLLLYGNDVINHSLLTTHYSLVVPHPRMHERRFVLEPLMELDPEGRHPLSKMTWKKLLEEVQDQKIQRMKVML